MARQVEQITVECPSCGRCFDEWAPAGALELELGCDPQLADPGFVRSAATATCPHCGFGVCVGAPLPPEHEPWRGG